MSRGDRRAAFPDPRRAPHGAPVAIGGDLSSETLLAAYSLGIFPWFDDDDGPILWWSPDPRCVIVPGRMHVSRRLARRLRRGEFRFSFNRAFEAVIDACARPRSGGEGTWITPRMREAYVRLHREGHAHSVEAWRDGELAGGAYGVALHRIFFAESMFTGRTDAGKAALARLDRALAERNCMLIDCQMPTPHLLSLGAIEIPRGEFLDRAAANRLEAAAPAARPESIIPPA